MASLTNTPDLGLTPVESDAFNEVADYINAYLNSRDRLARNGISLSSYVLSELIDAGVIAGHAIGGDTLELYSSSLASALRKLDARLPMPSHPLAPLSE